MQVDFDKILDPMSPYLKAIVPRRDSNLGQGLLIKLAQKYSVGQEQLWKDLPERFQHVVLFGDEELIRVNYGGSRNYNIYNMNNNYYNYNKYNK